jgi:hypothetical protein
MVFDNKRLPAFPANIFLVAKSYKKKKQKTKFSFVPWRG